MSRSLWPSAELAPDSLATASLFQKARHRVAALWGSKRAIGSLRIKHEMLWQLLREVNRWFDAVPLRWDTEGLYRVPGNAQDVERLFSQWAAGTAAPLPASLSPHLVASFLKRCFRDLLEVR